LEKPLMMMGEEEYSRAQAARGAPSKTILWYSSSEMNCTPVRSQCSQSALSSSGVKIAPVGFAGLERIRPLMAGSPAAARSCWPAARTAAVTLYFASTGREMTSTP